jgi:hypothetical protein
MPLQLLQLLAAGRSPSAADEYQYRSLGAEYVCESDCSTIAGQQCKRRCYVSNPEAYHFSGHPRSPTPDNKGLQAYFDLLSYDAHRVNASTPVAVASPLPVVVEYAMFVAVKRRL